MSNNLYSSPAKQTKNKLSAGNLTRYASLFGICMVSSVPALADPSPALDRVSLSVGAFYAEPRFNAGIDTPFGRVDTPDRTSSKVTIPRVRADLLIFDSQGISFDYYRYDKSHNLNVAGDSTVDGQPVTGSANFRSDLKIDLARLSYKWWLGSGNDVFGIGLGGAYYRADISGNINGSVSTPGQTFTDGASDRFTDDAVAPLIELGWRHAFTPNLRTYVEASGVKKNGGTLEGHIYNANAGIEWYPWHNIGLVADYGVSKVKLQRNGDSSTADLDVRFSGPSLFIKARF